MKQVDLVDASILINIVGVPHESQDRGEVLLELQRRVDSGVDLMLPIAAVVETAQHVQRIVNGDRRRKCAEVFVDVISQTLARSLPWTFVEASWDGQLVGRFLDQGTPAIPNFVESMTQQSPEAGDLLLLAEWSIVRNNLSRQTHSVGVWTLDDRLNAIVSHLS